MEPKDAAGEQQVTFIDPPFNFNAPSTTQFAPELTGNIALQSMCRRIGWRDLSGKLLLDFGCGVRLARTIVNLQIPIEMYVGIDLNPASIAWMRANIKTPGLYFHYFNIAHEIYNKNGTQWDDAVFPVTEGQGKYDAASMFSVITHQLPDEARHIFSALRKEVSPDGQMYFTTFLDSKVNEYAEGDPNQPQLYSTYNPAFLVSLVEREGWRVLDIFNPMNFQAFAVRCGKV
jgi:2-polyprenyl-3-methyl-5-hydroxy-6-metoxy-1,4-benzoquinol methylase